MMAKTPLGLISRTLSNKKPKIILAYHGIHPSHSLCVKPEEFRKQVLYVIENYNVVSICELLNGKNDYASKPPISITFDDAYLNLKGNALPILEEIGISATIFVPVKYIGKRNEWDKNCSNPLLRLLSVSDLKEITRKNSITIGSHGMTHRRLSELSNRELHEEVAVSKLMLEDLIGMPVESIAYPYGMRGDYNYRVLRLVEEKGYLFGLSSRFGRYNNIHEKYELRRISVKPFDNIVRFKDKLEGKYDWVSKKETIAYKLRVLFKYINFS